jgi:hypothetical protein
MTRSSTWIGVVSFVLAMLMTISIDLAGRDVALSGISLGGLPAFAKDRRDRGGGLQIELPSALETLSELSEAAEDGDDGDDDEGPDDDGGDDN